MQQRKKEGEKLQHQQQERKDGKSLMAPCAAAATDHVPTPALSHGHFTGSRCRWALRQTSASNMWTAAGHWQCISRARTSARS